MRSIRSPRLRIVRPRSMLLFRNFLFLALLPAAGLSGTGNKPYPVYTLDNLVTTMKLVGRNFTAVNASLSTNDFETAKAQITRSRELLAVTITFWRDKKKDDAIGILRDAVTKMDSLDAALSVEKIDAGQAPA